MIAFWNWRVGQTSDVIEDHNELQHVSVLRLRKGVALDLVPAQHKSGVWAGLVRERGVVHIHLHVRTLSLDKKTKHKKRG